MSSNEWDSVVAKLVEAHDHAPDADVRSLIETFAPQAESDPGPLIDHLREKATRLVDDLGKTRSPYEATKVGSELRKYIRTLRSVESSLAVTH